MGSTHVSLHNHIVFSTKRRLLLIDDAWRARLFEFLGGSVRAQRAVPVAVGGIADHVHLLVGMHTMQRLGDLLREIKSASSQWIHNEFAVREFQWQRGYGAFAVSPSAVDRVARYVLTQEERHRNLSYEDEYLALLRRSGVPYDPRYVWAD